MDNSDCVALMQWATPKLGLRWKGFRNVRGQVCKRIARRARELGVDAQAYRERLEADPDEWARFDGFCRVSISRFYRDRAVYEALGRLLPPLLEAEGFRAWSAGAASGEEPYTLALLLRLGLKHPAEILATELDPVLRDRARRGCYPRATLQELPEQWVREAFEERDGELCLREPFRAGVQFEQRDLRRSLPEGPFQLVLCRNLAFTYFDEENQRRFLEALKSRVPEGGLLVIGGHEKLPEPHLGWAPAVGASPIFRRVTSR